MCHLPDIHIVSTCYTVFIKKPNQPFSHFVFIWITKWTSYTEHIMHVNNTKSTKWYSDKGLFFFVRQVTTVQYKWIQYCVFSSYLFHLYLALDHKMLLKWNVGLKYLIASLKCAEEIITTGFVSFNKTTVCQEVLRSAGVK